MRDTVGKIIGTASAFEFEFNVVNPRLIKRGDYIKVWNDNDGWVLAQVSEIFATESSRALEKFKELRIGKARVLGKREGGKIILPSTPFIPGEKVYLAEDSMIAETLGFEKDGIYLGLLKDTNVKVVLDPNDLVQKHVCILAKTGSGKSYTAGVIIEELLDRNVPLLIIDPHGEYVSLKKPNKITENEFGVEPKGYADKVCVYAPPTSPFLDNADREICLENRNLSPEELIELTDLRSPSAQALLYQVVRKLEDYTISDIIREVEKIKHSSKWSLIGALSKIESSGLFKDRPTDVRELMRKGKASVIDLRGVETSYQTLIVSRLVSRLFELRKRGEVEPGMIVVEEAHNFVPEREKTVSTSALRTIASEGRKFGLGLMVISQRPARVDKNVISQCNTQIIMRVTNPNDLAAIKKSIEGITSEMIEEVKRLPPGYAIVVSPKIDVPVIVRIRVRKSLHSEAVKIVDSDDFEESKEVLRKKSKTEQSEREKRGFLSRLFKRG